jgi:hypothetical protein
VLSCCAAFAAAQEGDLPFAVPPADAPEMLPPPKVVAPEDVQKPMAVFEPFLLPDKPPPKIWTGGLEVGLAGADGNSTNFKFRTGYNTRAENERNLFKLDVNYNYANTGQKDLENRALAKSRYECLFPGSKWSWFNAGELEYDEFRAFDLRLAAHTGAAYVVLKTDKVHLKSRLGGGASREIGGPANEFKPEILMGFDFELKIAARQKFIVVCDYYPTVIDWSDYRVETRANYEVLIDPDWNLTLRVGLLNRYDNTPEGKLPNDIDYYMTILWKY